MAYDEKLAGEIRAMLCNLRLPGSLARTKLWRGSFGYGERGAVVRTMAVREMKMFGGLAFMLNDHMLCGVQKDMLMARVGPDEYARSLRRPFVREMDFTGRPMKGYVYVMPEGIKSEDDLRGWVDLCAEFVMTLPPKRKR